MMRLDVRAMLDELRGHVEASWFRSRYFADVPIRFSRISEFRNELFPKSGPQCWLDQTDAFRSVDVKLARGEIDAAEGGACRKWIVDGYWVAKGLLDSATLDACWDAYEKALSDGVVEKPGLGPGGFLERTLNPHFRVTEIRELMRHENLLHYTNLFLGRKTIPFQTIMGHAGSGQGAHSDAIHMTTYPLGYLVAAWIAFEDIHPDSGPLLYFPKSHRLPYVLSAEAGIGEREFKQMGYRLYAERYEPLIRSCCARYGFEPKTFCAKKGDVLFWHANLVHGGSPRIDTNVSRKALVCHYFAEGAVTYHDLSGNPSPLHARGMYAPVVERVYESLG
jgi:hypothetical protein